MWGLGSGWGLGQHCLLPHLREAVSSRHTGAEAAHAVMGDERHSRSPSSISVCCRMWRLHSPWAGNARGRSAGGGVSLGHDPTAAGMGTGQVRDHSNRTPTLNHTARPRGPGPLAPIRRLPTLLQAVASWCPPPVPPLPPQ